MNLQKKFYVNDRVFKEGDYISLNGSLGEVYAGVIESTDAQLSENFKLLMKWSDQYRKLGVYTKCG